jgi:dTMP kinase
MKGKLIVIDGGDGAGKATQVALLVKRLMAEGHKVETLDFPQYTQNHFGKLIRQCLDGKRGDFMTVDARIASTLYAADRFESKPRLEQWLAEGKVVVLDRYVSANMMHQGAKIDDPEKLEDFLGWLDHMEHEVFDIPRPDQIIYLEVPNAVRVALKARAIEEGKHGQHIKLDQAERNNEHQEATEMRARTIVASKNNWHLVSCCENSEMRSREAIHEDVYQVIKAVV